MSAGPTSLKISQDQPVSPQVLLPGEGGAVEVVVAPGEEAGEGVGGARRGVRGRVRDQSLPDTALSPLYIVSVGQDPGLGEGLEEGEEALERSQGGDDSLLPLGQ